MNTPYQLLAREKKARTLANHLAAHGITSQEARDITPEIWKKLAFAAHVIKPSEETVALVIEMLAERERLILERMAEEAAHV